MLTRVRNASNVGLDKVYVVNTNLILGLVKILKEEGFITNFRLTKLIVKQKTSFFICIFLKFRKGLKKIPYISFLKRVSKSSFRVYLPYRKISLILGGVGLSIFYL